jgi:hypothetical protein
LLRLGRDGRGFGALFETAQVFFAALTFLDLVVLIAHAGFFLVK